jgi:hypothetical protein
MKRPSTGTILITVGIFAVALALFLMGVFG